MQMSHYLSMWMLLHWDLGLSQHSNMQMSWCLNLWLSKSQYALCWHHCIWCIEGAIIFIPNSVLKYSFRSSVLFACKNYISLAERYLVKLYNNPVALHLYGNQAAGYARWFQVLLKGKCHPGAQSLFWEWLCNYSHDPIQIIADKILSQIRIYSITFKVAVDCSEWSSLGSEGGID